MSAGIERLLLALDPSPSSQAACSSALALAEALRAELVGIFGWDTDLLRSAELPVTREVGVTTGRLRGLEVGDIEAELRIHERRTRTLLELAASRTSVATSFQVTRVRIRRQPARRHSAVRAVIESAETADQVVGDAQLVADRLGLGLEIIAVGDVDQVADERVADTSALEVRLLEKSSPIVLAASSALATPERLASLSCGSGALIALAS